jgi:hypothetical protein
MSESVTLQFDEATNNLKVDLTVSPPPSDDLVIDDSNFESYFFDVRKHRPKPGQVMARFTAMADFVDGQMKRDVVYLLRECKGGAKGAQRVMRKLAGAVEGDSIRVLREMSRPCCCGSRVPVRGHRARSRDPALNALTPLGEDNVDAGHVCTSIEANSCHREDDSSRLRLRSVRPCVSRSHAAAVT